MTYTEARVCAHSLLDRFNVDWCA